MNLSFGRSLQRSRRGGSFLCGPSYTRRSPAAAHRRQRLHGHSLRDNYRASWRIGVLHLWFQSAQRPVKRQTQSPAQLPQHYANFREA